MAYIKGALSKGVFMSKKIRQLNNEELAMFCDQMAMVLDAGISPMEGIMVMNEDTDNEEGREILDLIQEKCDEGSSFHKALATSRVFPKYALDMVEIGEKSGKLDEVMRSLAAHYRREENIAKGIKNAVTYPFIIIAMMLVVILVLVIKVLPIFNKVFTELGSEMTGFSKGLLNVGTALSKYSVIFVCIFLVLVACFLVLTKTKAGKKLKDKMFNSFIVTRILSEKIASGRFASAMAMTMSAGLDIDESLDMIAGLVDNKKMQDKIAKCKEYMAEGKTISDALGRAGIFSNTYSRMLMVGYKTGAMDKVLERIADGYEQEVDERISNAIAIIEPTLVIVLSVFICLVLMSVMLPLVGIMTSIG